MRILILSFLFLSASSNSFAQVSAQVKQEIDEVVSVFENSTTKIQYDSIEALGDGRGYTAGRAGFTTGTGDLLVVAERYVQLTQNSGFTKILPILKQRAADESDSRVGLESLPALWRQSCHDPIFIKVQDDVSDEMYFKPAQVRAARLGFNSNLGLLCVYDAVIQHGVDGFDAIAAQVNQSLPTEKARLLDLLRIRRHALMYPDDPATQVVWRESVGRVDALKKLVMKNAFTLPVPFSINPFGDTFVIR